tara:strand:- start:4994 stop:6076 length:1083 start_codon:yes stop_codon:yes gene_type:complete
MAGTHSNKKIGIIGGGVTGVITAIFLAQSGHHVTIFEKKELLSETSSRTTKLLHGGIRYLESLQIKEVKNGLNDRHWWLKNFPNSTKKIEILIPFKNVLSMKFIKYFFGIKFYELLSLNKTLGKGRVILKNSKLNTITNTNYKNYLTFFDGAMDDKSLSKKLRCELKDLEVNIFEHYEVQNFNVVGQIDEFNFDKIILAAGPWTKILLDKNNIESEKDIDFIKGSHLILNRYIETGFMFDGICKTRYVFALPYGNNTLLGTTEKRVHSPDNPDIDNEEKDYLINSFNLFFKDRISEHNVISSFSGVRPLIKSLEKDFHRSTRDFHIQNSKNLISIFGGKWTTAPSTARKIVTIIDNEHLS